VFIDVEAVRQGLDPEAGLKEPVWEAIEIPESFGPLSLTLDESFLKELAFCLDDYSFLPQVLADPDTPIPLPSTVLANPLLQLFTLRYSASRVVGLHVEEEMWFLDPPRLGEVVSLEGTYTEKFVRRGEGMVAMEAESRGADGRLLVRHRGVEIMRTQPGAVAGRSSAPLPRDRRQVHTGFRPDRPRLSCLVGEMLEADLGLVPLKKRPTQAQMAVFSRIGDWVSNIHNDLQKARRAGLAVPIVQGQQLFCYAIELLTKAIGPAWLTSGHLLMKFLKPVAAFEEIEIGGALRDIRPDGTLDLDVFVTKPGGILAAVGWAEGRIH